MPADGLNLPALVPGPVERCLETLLTENGRLPLRIEPCQRRNLGDFRVSDADVQSAEAGAALAGRLAAFPIVDSALAVPPNVYVTSTIEALHDALVAGVAESQHCYLHSAVGADRVVQVQFSCPNMNKSLHLGHLRTNVIGVALANAMAAVGFRVIRTDQPSNWGRHIAKACVAATRRGWPPLDTDRADRAAGELYNECNQALGDPDPAQAAETAAAVAAMMARIDAGEPEAVALNAALTESVYREIGRTYDRIGTHFDAVLREGDTVPLVKAIIEAHIGTEVVRREDGSVVIDLSDVGLREVNLLRREGDPLLHAFFLGASTRRHALWPGAPFLFLMGREYAPTVPELQEVVRRLSSPGMADAIEPVFHGMVTRGTKKMSSRDEAVDVDDLLDTVAARLRCDWQATADAPLDPYHHDVVERFAVALVKYHFLRVPRMKDLRWDPYELWAEGLPRMARVVRILSTVPNPSASLPSRGKAADELRSLFLAINSLPDAVREVVVRRDPAHLARVVDDVCERAEAASRRGDLTAGMGQAINISIRNALAVLGIALPPFLAVLPPSARSGTLLDAG